MTGGCLRTHTCTHTHTRRRTAGRCLGTMSPPTSQHAAASSASLLRCPRIRVSLHDMHSLGLGAVILQSHHTCGVTPPTPPPPSRAGSQPAGGAGTPLMAQHDGPRPPHAPCASPAPHPGACSASSGSAQGEGKGGGDVLQKRLSMRSPPASTSRLVNGNATDEQTPPLSAPASRGFASPSEGPPPCVSPRPDLTLHADEISPAMPASPAGEGRQGQGASASWEPLLSNGPPDNGPVLEGIASPSEEPPPRASPRSDLTLHVAETPPASIPASPSEGTNSPDHVSAGQRKRYRRANAATECASLERVC